MMVFVIMWNSPRITDNIYNSIGKIFPLCSKWYTLKLYQLKFVEEEIIRFLNSYIFVPNLIERSTHCFLIYCFWRIDIPYHSGYGGRKMWEEYKWPIKISIDSVIPKTNYSFKLIPNVYCLLLYAICYGQWPRWWIIFGQL